jgi:ankyrin repeat protein
MGDLSKVFSSSRRRDLTKALKRRFDGLPIHEKCYYQSYHPIEVVLADLERIIDSSTIIDPARAQQSKKKLYHRIIFTSRKPHCDLNIDGNEQDCLGMTPLHILACSTRHDIRLYELLIEKCPDNLITRDKWGDIPLLYAFWSNAPREILQLLIETQTSLFPDHAVKWVRMVKTLGRADAPLSCIQSLLETHRATSPNKEIWQDVLVEWAKVDARNAWPSIRVFPYTTFRHILKFDISTRLDSLGVEPWRQEIESDIDDPVSLQRFSKNNEGYLKMVYAKVVSYEHLKEATSLLELSLWKAKIDQSMPNDRREGRITYRNQCHINSGAEIVVPNVLPYLFPVE